MQPITSTPASSVSASSVSAAPVSAAPVSAAKVSALDDNDGLDELSNKETNVRKKRKRSNTPANNEPINDGKNKKRNKSPAKQPFVPYDQSGEVLISVITSSILESSDDVTVDPGLQDASLMAVTPADSAGIQKSEKEPPKKAKEPKESKMIVYPSLLI